MSLQLHPRQKDHRVIDEGKKWLEKQNALKETSSAQLNPGNEKLEVGSSARDELNSKD
jgi:hypothetical protein